jgi:hypothetical protein
VDRGDPDGEPLFLFLVQATHLGGDGVQRHVNPSTKRPPCW